MPAAATVELLAALLTGDWSVAEATEPRIRREASTLVAAFVAWHLDRGLRSLPHLDLSADVS
jgi:DNA repair protein RecO (recombination protein O)